MGDLGETRSRPRLQGKAKSVAVRLRSAVAFCWRFAFCMSIFFADGNFHSIGKETIGADAEIGPGEGTTATPGKPWESEVRGPREACAGVDVSTSE